MGALCGQSPQDPRFHGEPTVTCSDNAAYHASRVDPAIVAQIPVLMFRDLLERRLFDHTRLFDRWYLMVLDGSLKEKCRQGFPEGGKSSTGVARYRYVLQLAYFGVRRTVISELFGHQFRNQFGQRFRPQFGQAFQFQFGQFLPGPNWVSEMVRNGR